MTASFQVLKITKHFGMNTMYSLWPQIYKIYISSSFVFFFFSFPFFLYMKLGLRFKGWQSGLRGVRRSAQCSVLVSLHVQRQVVGAGEAAVAHPALERLGTRVLPVVAGQLVRPRKPPVAALPGALVGLLTCKEETREGEGLPQDRVQSPHHALKAPES